MRNMTIIALFRAYANRFRGDAVLAIEEPELYLHPHARAQFGEAISRVGRSRIANSFYHYTFKPALWTSNTLTRYAWLSAKKTRDGESVYARFDRFRYRTLLTATPWKLFPSKYSSPKKAYVRVTTTSADWNIQKHFFARKIVVVEGESEEYALPIYAAAMDYDFDTSRCLNCECTWEEESRLTLPTLCSL